MNTEAILKHVAKRNLELAINMRAYPQSYKFERHQRRPVYVVQVFTANIARNLDLDFRYLRIIKRVGGKAAQVREIVAEAVKLLRASPHNPLNPHTVRDVFEERINDPKGYAQRVDMDAALAQVQQ